MRTDADYRDALMYAGVRADLIDHLSGQDLDRVGNIMGVYRTSMQEQDPIAFRIRQFMEARGMPSAATDARTILRDKFAGLAMQAIYAGTGAQQVADRDQRYNETNWSEVVASNAYEMADAMLRERERR